MSDYNATYTVNGHAQPATVSFLKDKIAVRLAALEGDKTVYWFYRSIKNIAGSTVSFTYTAYPPQTLELLDQSQAAALARHASAGLKASVRNRNRTAGAILAAGILFLAFVYFFILPWSAVALAARVPAAYEKQLGTQLFASIKSNLQVDEKRSLDATAFFQALQFPSAYPIKVIIVKSAVANAFALPGGYIVVYDKLLNELPSYPELAALLAHEFIHIQNRHSLKSLFRQASSTLFFSTLLGDAGAIGGAVINSANNLKALSYSRSLERESDEAGLLLLTARNIDGNGFVRLFRILQDQPETQQPEWTSSHPNLQKRITNISENPAFKQQHARTDATLNALFQKLKRAD